MKILWQQSFEMDQQQLRLPISDFDETLRECLVNCLAHADYIQGYPSTKVDMYDGWMCFTNPGKMLVTQTFDYDDEALEDDTDNIPDESVRKPGKLFSSLAFIVELGAGRTKKAGRFRVGDHVRVKYRGQEGTIVDINGDMIMVSLKDGRKVDSYYESELEKAW